MTEVEGKTALSEPPVAIDLGKRFEILGRLGEGGMGQVYKVRDRELDVVAALKVLSSEYVAGDRLDRMRREVRLARRIASPRVCRIHDIVELPDGSRGVSMELVRGRSLAAWIQQGAGRDHKRVARWAADIADGLSAAHTLGIIHRDLKPENVIIDEEDRAVVLDFGVAYEHDKADTKLTAAGFIVGTVPYMAPEQLTGSPLDARADLYALGLLVAEALTGTIPLAGDSSYAQVLKLRINTPLPYSIAALRPDLPARLADLIDALLNLDRDQRPPTAFVVRDELLDILDSGTTTVPEPKPITSVLEAPPSRGPLIGIAAAMIGAIVVLTAVLLFRRPTPEPTRVPLPEPVSASPTPTAEPTSSPSTSAAPSAAPATPKPTRRASALPEPEPM